MNIENSTVPIGYGVEDMEVVLLDEEGVEVENGNIGEIALKSEYLALGYWQKPELTQINLRRNNLNQGLMRISSPKIQNARNVETNSSSR